MQQRARYPCSALVPPGPRAAASTPSGIQSSAPEERPRTRKRRRCQPRRPVGCGTGWRSSPAPGSTCTARSSSTRRSQGGTLDEAAQFLGISTPGKTIGFTTKLTHYLRVNNLLHDFELALDAIAADLLSNPLVDYQRRQDTATWQPPAAGYRCTYATDWVTVKTRWGLAIDAAEQTALTNILTECPNNPIEVILAR